MQTQSAHDSNILACTKTRYHQCIAGVVLMDEHSARGIVQQELGRGGLLQHALNDAHELHSRWKTDHRTDAMPSFNLVMQTAMWDTKDERTHTMNGERNYSNADMPHNVAREKPTT